MRAAIPMLLLQACSLASQASIEPVWPEGQAAVVIATDLEGNILAPTPLLITSSPSRFAIELDEELILYARTYPDLDRDLEGCRVSAGQLGQELGPPRGSWSSGPISPGGAIRLAVEEEPQLFQLRLMDCILPPRSCEAIGEQIVAPPTYFGLSGAVALSNLEMLAVGSVTSPEDARTVMMKVVGDVAALLEPIDGIIHEAANVETDGWGIIGAADRTIFRLDFDGTPISTATVAFEIADLSTGTDGTTIIVGKHGELMSTKGWNLRPTALEVPWRDLGLDTPKVAVVHADLFLAYGPDAILYAWEGGWSELLAEPIDAIAADERFFISVPETGASIVRFDRTTREWSTVGQLFFTSRPKKADAFGDGRFLIGGQGGLIGYFNGERACLVLTGSMRAVRDLDVAPSGRVAYAVGEGEEISTPPSILRLTFPR